MRVGVIDCGTHTVRLLIADAGGPDGRCRLRDVVRTLRFVRLGQGVDATHRLNPEALTRTFAALDEYSAMIAAHGVDALRFLATSAVRDAENRDEFLAGVQLRLGVTPHVITGEEEARLSYRGAQASYTPGAEAAAGEFPPGRCLVMDIGGGSTELILGDAEDVITARSFDIGSVRLRERLLVGDPPTPEQVAEARRLVDATVAPFFGDPVETFIGVAGTSTSLAAMKLGLTTYDATRVDRSTLLPGEIGALTEHLLASSIASVRAQYPFLEPRRAEVICAGALICDSVANMVGRPMIVRETDILDGAALALVAQR